MLRSLCVLHILVPVITTLTARKEIMRIGSEKEYIEIIEHERMPDDTPTPGDVRIKVRVRLKEFSGSYEDVWLEKLELDNFLSVFTKLVETRNGKARINSMSPDEFWVEFRPIDRAGHFEVEVQLKRFQYSGPTYWPTIVAGGFEFDPTTLPEIEKAFKKLAGITNS